MMVVDGGGWLLFCHRGPVVWRTASGRWCTLTDCTATVHTALSLSLSPDTCRPAACTTRSSQSPGHSASSNSWSETEIELHCQTSSLLTTSHASQVPGTTNRNSKVMSASIMCYDITIKTKNVDCDNLTCSYRVTTLGRN